MAVPCIYCGLPAASDEHVISGALGCKEILRDVVCEACNNTYGHTFEAKFVNGLALFLNFFQIRNERGVVPSVDLEGKIGDQRIKLVMTGDGKVLIPPKKLHSKSTSSGHEKEFKIFDKRQETRIASSLRSRHQGLVWTRLDTTDGKEIIDVQAAFD